MKRSWDINRHHRDRMIAKRRERLRWHNWLDCNGDRWNDYKQEYTEWREPTFDQPGRLAKKNPYTARMWTRDDWEDKADKLHALDRQNQQDFAEQVKEQESWQT